MPNSRKTSSVNRNAVAGRPTGQGEENRRIRRGMTAEGNRRIRRDVPVEQNNGSGRGNPTRPSEVNRRIRSDLTAEGNSGKGNSGSRRNGQTGSDRSPQVELLSIYGVPSSSSSEEDSERGNETSSSGRNGQTGSDGRNQTGINHVISVPRAGMMQRTTNPFDEFWSLLGIRSTGGIPRFVPRSQMPTRPITTNPPDNSNSANRQQPNEDNRRTSVRPRRAVRMRRTSNPSDNFINRFQAFGGLIRPHVPSSQLPTSPTTNIFHMFGIRVS